MPVAPSAPITLPFSCMQIRVTGPGMRSYHKALKCRASRRSSWHLRAATAMMAIPRTALFALSLLLVSASHVHGLQVTPNSPCKSKCATGTAGTTENGIVCLDSDYNSTVSGSQFQQCVECELSSKAADPITGTTDVMWGLCKSMRANSALRTLSHSLDNLRYALSACMYGFPTQMVSLSSPCQVTCTPLSTAIESGLGTNATTADLSFCNTANFTTTLIQNCVFCYGLMDQQKYLANCMPVRIFTSIRILTDSPDI
jgi:hypothetical protein